MTRWPDIVLLMTDQQRHDQVGYRSVGFYETPVLGELARRGVAFENAYSIAEWGELEVGKAPELKPRRPAGSGGAPFRYRLRFHPTTWVAEQARAFIAERSTDRPLFLVVSFPHPPTPLNPLGPCAAKYDPVDSPVPSVGYGANDGRPTVFRDAIEHNGAVYKPWRVHEHGDDALRLRLAQVRALVSHIDDALGTLLPLFPLERTVVAFTSDHGDYAGHRGLGGKSPWIPFDDLVRVPLVLAGLGIAPDRASEALVQSSDLPLTFCDLAGVPLPVDESEFDSCSLTPHLGGAPPVGIGDRAARFLFNAGWPGARLGTAKLICHWPSWTTMLFDLDQDPDETVDVSADPAYADTRRELESIVWDGIFRDPPAGLIDWVASEASSEAAR